MFGKYSFIIFQLTSIFVTYTLSGADPAIYIINVPEKSKFLSELNLSDYSHGLENTNINPHKRKFRYKARNLLDEYLSQQNKNKIQSDELDAKEFRNSKKCGNVFGSMYGAKAQKYRCLKMYFARNKKEQLTRITPQNRKPKNIIKDPGRPRSFIDFTRADTGPDLSHDYIKLNKPHKNYLPSFSMDYIDFGNLRAAKEVVRQTEKPISLDYIDGSFREDDDETENIKIVMYRKTDTDLTINATKDLNENKRARYDSGESGSEDSSAEVVKSNKHKKSGKIPMRFQVIKNKYLEESQSSASRENKHQTRIKLIEKSVGKTDGDWKSSSSDEIPPPKKMNSKKGKIKYGSASKEINHPNRNKLIENTVEKSVEDSKSTTSDEILPPKKLNSKTSKYFYMQGSRIVDVDSDQDARRRLKHFLPKRFHWNEDDLPKLGYFWFNGPRGKYK